MYLIWLLCLRCLFPFVSLIVFVTSFHSYSRIFPGRLLLWLLPLPSHWSPCSQHCPKPIWREFTTVISCPSSFSCLPLFCPYQPFIRYSQSLYKFILIIKIPPLLIFLYTPCLFNHPSQKNSWRKTERNRVSCLLSLTECFAQQSRYKGQNTFLLSYCNRLPCITKGIAHFILFLLGLNPYPFPFLCCLEVNSQLTISCSNGSSGM